MTIIHYRLFVVVVVFLLFKSCYHFSDIYTVNSNWMGFVLPSKFLVPIGTSGHRNDFWLALDQYQDGTRCMLLHLMVITNLCYYWRALSLLDNRCASSVTLPARQMAVLTLPTSPVHQSTNRVLSSHNGGQPLAVYNFRCDKFRLIFAPSLDHFER